MRSLVALGVLLVPSLALAGKLEPGSAHSPPLIADEPGFILEVVGKSDAGYGWHSHVQVRGFSSKTDRLRMEWKQGKKLLATVKCDIGIEGDEASGSCDNRDTPVKAVGELTAELIFSDDQTDKDYLVRTYKVQVVHHKGQWESWGGMGDDQLGAAWVWHGNAEAGNSTYRMAQLYITFASGYGPKDPQLRCTVDGKKKIPDIELGAESGSDTDDTEIDIQPKGGKRLTYHWYRGKYLINIYYGKRDTLKWDMGKKLDPDKVLSDNPGKWECNLRSEGKVLRILNFTVNADGFIQNGEFNTGTKNAVPMYSDMEAMIEVRLTKDSAAFDQRINPAAMKKSLQFGLPWPEHPAVKAMQSSYPAKSGLPDPPK